MLYDQRTALHLLIDSPMSVEKLSREMHGAEVGNQPAMVKSTRQLLNYFRHREWADSRIPYSGSRAEWYATEAGRKVAESNPLITQRKDGEG